MIRWQPSPRARRAQPFWPWALLILASGGLAWAATAAIVIVLAGVIR